MYRVLIQELNETGEVKVLHDGKHKNIMMLAEAAEDAMVTEAILNFSIARAASTIAQSKSFFEAAKLAVVGKMLMEQQQDKEVEGDIQ